MEEGGGPQAAGVFQAAQARVGQARFVGLAFAAHVLGRVVGDGLDLLGRLRQRGQVEVEIPAEEGHLPLALGFVLAFEACRQFAVVAGHRVEGFIGQAILERVEVEHARQRIAALDAVVEEGQRFAFGVAFQPEGDARQFNRQRVFIHAVDAVGDHITGGFADALRGGFVLTAADARQFLAQAPRRRQQEMPGAAGRVEDFQRKKRRFLFLRSSVLFQAFLHYRLQRAFDQFADQFGRGVIGAGGLALRTRRQLKSQAVLPIRKERGVIIQQTFIHRAEFFGIQRGVVDAARGRRTLLIICQMPEGGEQVAVADERPVQLQRGKQLAVQRRRLQLGGELFIGQDQPEGAQRKPQVCVVSIGGALVCQTAQVRNPVMFQIERLAADQSALFGNQQEEKTIDQPQQFTVERQRAVLFHPAAQVSALRMTQ